MHRNSGFEEVGKPGFIHALLVSALARYVTQVRSTILSVSDIARELRTEDEDVEYPTISVQ